MQIIPLTNYPEQTFRITLDGVALFCRVYWNAYDATCKEIVGNLDGQWRMDIASETITVSGMALVAGCDLLEPFGFDELGGLWLESDCNIEEMGELYRLIYIPIAEVADYNRAIGYAR
jgi:hypothetical protein